MVLYKISVDHLYWSTLHAMINTIYTVTLNELSVRRLSNSEDDHKDKLENP